MILDAGTGIRNVGIDIAKSGYGPRDDFLLVFSHTHWDHIQGFPFFAPAYDPKRRFTLVFPKRSGYAKSLHDIFSAQMQAEYFPVPLDKMRSDIQFLAPEAVRRTWGHGGTATIREHNHPGGAYGYRVEEGDKTMVYCTDIEHGDDLDPKVISLSKDADLLIHDAQYSDDELEMKKGWGHSSWNQAMAVAEQAGVKNLVLTHHDPDHDDAFLQQVEKECQSRFPNAVLAREGMEITV